eukprot:g42284.t1
MVTLASHCSPDREYLTVKCLPYYLPCKFTSAILTAVYIPPYADVKNALDEIYTATNALKTKSPEALFIVAGGFNQDNLKKKIRSQPCVLPPSLQAEAEMGGSFTESSTMLVRGSRRASPGLLGIAGLTIFKNSADNLDEYATTVMDFINIRSVFLRGNPRKATSPDRVPSNLDAVQTSLLRHSDISLLQAEFPICFKKTTIIPVPKKTHA